MAALVGTEVVPEVRTSKIIEEEEEEDLEGGAGGDPENMDAQLSPASEVEEVPQKAIKLSKKRKAVADAADATFGWTAGTSLYREQFEAASKVLPLSKLVIDTNAVKGQTRQINMMHVNTIVESFAVRPPLDMVDALVWNDGCVLSHFIQ